MARRSAIRASDEDREQVAERLRVATGEGRLVPRELEDRLTVALTAKTHGQLDVLVSDLPASGGSSRAMPIWARATLGVAGAVGVVAAAATAAMLFTLIAFLSAVWMLFERTVLGRERRVVRDADQRARALSARRELRRSLPRGERASL
jgi:branched-subunit amino acid ABC-type transport system permease component